MRRPCSRRRRCSRETVKGGGGMDAEKTAALQPAKRLRRPAYGDADADEDDDAFDRLPDDLVLAVLARVAAAAASPADVATARLTCRRFRELAAHSAVLSRASAAAVTVRAGGWSEAAHRFLRQCAAAGSLHACYFLGMVRFYCLGSRATGATLLSRAASRGHAAALYALAVVRFNGSGRDKADHKDPRAGAALCARAAWLGHIPALRELGHCLQDGYGARRDAAAGRRLLLHAATRELLSWRCCCRRCGGGDGESAAVEDAAGRFMVAWWESADTRRAATNGKDEAGCEDDGAGAGAGRRLCSQARCGRRETRRHEFRRCSACGAARYCSRACQALHWKREHRGQCAAGGAH